MTNVSIRYLQANDSNEFISLAKRSENFHSPWIKLPQTEDAFLSYLQKFDHKRNISFAIEDNHKLAGIVNLNEIIRGAFQNAFLGYYVFKGFEGKGVMYQGLKQVIKKAFTEYHLHRLEANIQPGNTSSIALVKRNQFRFEGLAKRYLCINNVWKDHERWAITKEDFIQ